ncbi:antitoxin YezG family protein [Bacillus atrophaeus]|uniref:antitoxin YezG family protein n=1 Tax=Bacillus atrophaeus TaxID=1452 RepID=UPI000B926D28|nr:antitoxin YezG family protein [Bacillus atrophaeus]ASS70223.1 TIGR01741 family protein [Bacillus atrophaeus]MBJ7898227.1 antitoxin YezG family protein [Bacillus atrophaeus]PRR87752.1 TIGR01741 family protein [Bacillus atrophaeus]
METKKMEVLYQKIAEQINDMIPSEWSKVVLYAEILDGSREVYFFFQTPENDEYIYSHDIPEQFQVSKKIYTELLIDLQELFKQLHNEFKENNPEAWTNLTLNLESNGTFSIDYDYEDVIESTLDEYQRQMIWEYNNLGIFPEDEEDKEFVKDYLNIK